MNAEARARNVLWFVIDTLRADHLGCYGYFRNTSPTIDRLAREGAVFEQSYASAIATGPGFSCLISGRHAVNHGFYITPWDVPNAGEFDDEIPTLPEMIWAAGGITTAAFDNLMNFRSHMKQFVRGFEFYINVTRDPGWVHHEVTGDRVNERLLPWLKTYGGERFFAFVHYWDPHTPYNQPEEYRRAFGHRGGDLGDLEVRRAPAGYEYVPGWGKVGEMYEGDEERSIDLYDGEVRFTDHLIGQALAALAEVGALEETAIIITSDHGEQLGQHGIYGHAGLHEGTVRVPLIVWRPGVIPEGVRVGEGFARHVDNAPTILELLGAEPTGELDGESLLPACRGEAELTDTVFMETGRHRAVRRRGFKLIEEMGGGKVELYDVESDPMEVVNLAEERAELREELVGVLHEWVQGELEGQPDPMPATETGWTCYVGDDIGR
jgi:arylsulfatase